MLRLLYFSVFKGILKAAPLSSNVTRATSPSYFAPSQYRSPSQGRLASLTPRGTGVTRGDCIPPLRTPSGRGNQAPVLGRAAPVGGRPGVGGAVRRGRGAGGGRAGPQGLSVERPPRELRPRPPHLALGNQAAPALAGGEDWWSARGRECDKCPLRRPPGEAARTCPCLSRAARPSARPPARPPAAARTRAQPPAAARRRRHRRVR